MALKDTILGWLRSTPDEDEEKDAPAAHPSGTLQIGSLREAEAG